MTISALAGPASATLYENFGRLHVNLGGTELDRGDFFRVSSSGELSGGVVVVGSEAGRTGRLVDEPPAAASAASSRAEAVDVGIAANELRFLRVGADWASRLPARKASSPLC